MPSSKNCEPGSTNFFTRSRPVRRPFLCWESTALGPPPTQICSSSFLSWVSKSMMRRWLFWAAGALVSTVLFKTEADTQDLVLPTENYNCEFEMRIQYTSFCGIGANEEVGFKDARWKIVSES